MSTLPFPEGFLWGVATSAAQIEGAVDADGRGESIWDRFASSPGNIEDGSGPGTACDHYHRWREDIGLLRELEVGAYRFSVAWPRVLPEGRGRVNERGIDFYDRLVDGLLEARIAPFVTLYHWDLPQALEDRGGWRERDTAAAFVEFTRAVASRLGDRVRGWTTHNEPWCAAVLGHEEGHHAPGLRDPRGALRVAHHLLLSHGWAVPELRRLAPGAEVGIVLNLTPAMPHDPDRAEDRDAARWFDGFFNRWFLDPVFHGRYPEDAIRDRVARGHLDDTTLPFVEPGDMEAIRVPCDYLGVNYYSRAVLRAGPGGTPEAVAPGPGATDMGWEVYPQGLSDLLLRLRDGYHPPRIYLTENGVAYGEGPDSRGRIDDARRIAYLRDHLHAAHTAIAAGVPLAGYFVWSLMDNFEWGHGYTKRFGLYWVDPAAGTRLAKDSAAWYRGVAAANALPAPHPEPVSRRPS